MWRKKSIRIQFQYIQVNTSSFFLEQKHGLPSPQRAIMHLIFFLHLSCPAINFCFKILKFVHCSLLFRFFFRHLFNTWPNFHEQRNYSQSRIEIAHVCEIYSIIYGVYRHTQVFDFHSFCSSQPLTSGSKLNLENTNQDHKIIYNAVNRDHVVKQQKIANILRPIVYDGISSIIKIKFCPRDRLNSVSVCPHVSNPALNPSSYS